MLTVRFVALSYFRLSPSYKSGEQTLLFTASAASFYHMTFGPMYCGSKHAVWGFMRSIAKPFYYNDKIRVNSLHPGTVKTPIMEAEAWAPFPQDIFTPVEKIGETMLLVSLPFECIEAAMR